MTTKSTTHWLILILVLAVFTLPASATLITDVYIGATTPASGKWHNADRIGDADKFEITKMNVQINSGNLIVDVYSTYFDNIGALGTQLGDLFVSTNGWNPFGSEPYVGDKFDNGEKWEYGLSLDNHLSSTGGTFSLYALNTASPATYASQIVLSQVLTTSGIFRHDQEVQVNTSNVGPAITTGDWSIGNDSMGDFIRFQLNNYASHIGSSSNLGFHWAMTCANDVIEGVIPEPSTVILLGLGLIGLAGYGRARRNKKQS